MSDMCENCNVNEATLPHLCPYKDEINDDDTLCTCCPDCERECMENI